MKILSAFKALVSGTFLEKVNENISQKLIKNKNVLDFYEQAVAYDRLYKRYAAVLNTEVKYSFAGGGMRRVWICWLQGMDRAPALVKACFNSMKAALPDYEFIVLTEANIKEYVTFPDYIWEKRRRGIIPAAHFSDLLRAELLCRYGGIWADATLFCTAKPGAIPDYITDAPLFCFKQLDLTRRDILPIVSSSWFIVAKEKSAILAKTRELLYAYWTENDSLGDYFTFHLFFAMASRKYPEEWDRIPFFNNHSPHVLQFELDKKFSEKRWLQICAMSPLHKLNHHNDYSTCADSFYKHVTAGITKK